MDGYRVYAKKVNTMLEHTYFGCEAFPMGFPDLGPDQFAGFYGTPIEFGETTNWAHPDLKEVSLFQNKALNKQGVFYKRIKEMLHAMAEERTCTMKCMQLR